MPTDTATDARAALDAAACEPFLLAIVAHLGDALPRLVFADFLMERGADAEAAGQRWAAKHGRYPDTRDRGYAGIGGWHAGDAGGRGWARPWRLPAEVFWPHGFTDENYFDVDEPLAAERWFLHRCGELAWGDDGEPVP